MSYDLSQTLDPLGEDFASLSAGWLICVVRFKTLSTYDRAAKRSRSLDGTEVALERGQPLVIDQDCLTVTTSAPKGSHVKSMMATLAPGDLNYVSEIIPGDWALCWMVQDAEQLDDLKRRIRRRESCCEFMDGLKFVGRVQSLQKSFSVQPDGKKSVRYHLQASGFQEFNTSIFWDPYLAQSADSIKTWIGRVGAALNDFLNSTSGLIDANTAIPDLIEVFFGSGIKSGAANPSGEPALQIVTGSTLPAGNAFGSPEADDLDAGQFAYVVPESVGRLLGVRGRSKSSGVLAYADLLSSLYGTQRYGPAGDGPWAQFVVGPWAQFVPTGLGKMMGSFLLTIPQLTGRSVWSVLGQYLNPATNEMYTCLRVGPGGQVRPTIVVRQLPFTSAIGASTGAGGDQADLGVAVEHIRTPYLELPRWKVSPSMAISGNFGRSDALRFNFVHVYGQIPAQGQGNSITSQLVRFPPIRDDQDIRRSGLRPDIFTVDASPRDSLNGPPNWMDLRADILMGQHLTLTGTLSCLGIQEPIAEGDNLEWDGVVFHIEDVNHTGAMTPDGRRSFMTTLQLSHGVRVDPTEDRTSDNVATDDDKLFADTHPDDLTAADPGATREPSVLEDFFQADFGVP